MGERRRGRRGKSARRGGEELEEEGEGRGKFVCVMCDGRRRRRRGGGTWTQLLRWLCT